jgi:hypothetical protein
MRPLIAGTDQFEKVKEDGDAFASHAPDDVTRMERRRLPDEP